MSKNNGATKMIMKLTAFLLLIFSGFMPVSADDHHPEMKSTRPHVSHRSPNLVPNAAFKTSEHWTLLGDASWNANDSRTADGSGSLRLRTPIPNGSNVFSSLIPVQAGEQYTFSFFIRTTNGPTYAGAQVGLFTSNRDFIRNLIAGRLGTSRDGIWEEVALTLTVPAGTSFVQLQTYKTENTRGDGEVFVDDFYLGQGRSLEQPTAIKRPFSGEDVRVDSLGNFEIRIEDRWEPFFPLCIYSDNRRDCSVYSRQGWNTVIWTGSADQVAQAHSAVSDFNPQGMFAGFQLAQYTFPSGWVYNDLNDLSTKLREIRNRNLANRLLFYYWDNENNHDQWDVPASVIRTVREADADASGRPRRPVYVLQGELNVARTHAAHGLADVSGTYVGGGALREEGSHRHEEDTLFLLDHLQGQSSPAAFAQFNEVNDAGEMRRRIYISLIAGARAIGYWRDCYDSQSCSDSPAVGPVDKKPWWPDFPNLRREIDRLMPLIRMPHWTTWQAHLEPDIAVDVGTRDYAGESYLFLINRTTHPQTVTVRLEGLPYHPTEAQDYFNDTIRIPLRDSSLTLTLPPLGVGSGTCVLRLVTPPPQ